MTNPSVPSVPVNTYISFKPVKLVPNDIVPIAGGSSSAGAVFSVGVTEGDRPALYFKIFPQGAPQGLLYRCDFTRLVDSLVGARVAEEEPWEPLSQDTARPDMWGNELLTAGIKRNTLPDGTGYAHINYHRRDRAPIRDWRIGQRIKNQLCGPEWEGVELYPAESRVVDTSNEYHLFCMEGQFPIGFDQGERGTQAQIDANWDGPGDGPMQRDDPGADTSSFRPINWEKPTATVRTPQGAFDERTD